MNRPSPVRPQVGVRALKSPATKTQHWITLHIRSLLQRRKNLRQHRSLHWHRNRHRRRSDYISRLRNLLSVSKPSDRDSALGRLPYFALGNDCSTAQEGVEVEGIEFGAWVEDCEIWGALNGLLDGGGDYQGECGMRSNTDSDSRGIEYPGVEYMGDS